MRTFRSLRLFRARYRPLSTSFPPADPPHVSESSNPSAASPASAPAAAAPEVAAPRVNPRSPLFFLFGKSDADLVRPTHPKKLAFDPSLQLYPFPFDFASVPPHHENDEDKYFSYVIRVYFFSPSAFDAIFPFPSVPFEWPGAPEGFRGRLCALMSPEEHASISTPTTSPQESSADDQSKANPKAYPTDQSKPNPPDQSKANPTDQAKPNPTGPPRIKYLTVIESNTMKDAYREVQDNDKPTYRVEFTTRCVLDLEMYLNYFKLLGRTECRVAYVGPLTTDAHSSLLLSITQDTGYINVDYSP